MPTIDLTDDELAAAAHIGREAGARCKMSLAVRARCRRH
jgi:hypothetical protein